MQLGVVGSKINQSCTFFFFFFLDRSIVITLILTTDDQDGGRLHALQCIPASIYVGSLGVVDIKYAAHGAHLLQSVFHTREVAKTLADYLFLDTSHIRSDTGSQ